MITSTTPSAVPVWRVVIIEDSPEDRDEIRRLLLKGADRRYQFVEAETGAAGVRAVLDVSSGLPDCVVLDYTLPDTDAMEVLAAVIGPNGLTVCPVVVLTGTADARLGPAVLRAGAQDFIGKSWMSAESLTRAVENAAERWAMTRELQARTAALQASEAQLKLAVEVAGMGVNRIDYATNTVVLDTIAAALFGLKAGVPVSRSAIHDTFHPDDTAEIFRLMNQSLDPTGTGWFVMEHRVIHSDGSIRWLNVKKQVVFGDVTGVRRPVTGILAAVDITDRKMATEQLRTSDGRVRQVIDSMFAFVGMIAPDGTLTEANQPPLAAAGLTRGDVIGKLFWDCHWWNYDPAVQDRLRAAFDRAARGEVVRYDETIRVANDVRIEIDLMLQPVIEAGRLLFVIPSATDITDRKVAEQTIAQQVREMDALYAKAPIGLFQFDAELRFVRVNAWTAAINGRSVEAHIGRTVGEVLNPTVALTVEPMLRQVMQTGEPFSEIEVHGPTAANGEGRDWLVSYYPVLSAKGEIVGVHGTIQDITERKQQEKRIEDSRRSLYDVIERCPFGIYIVDADFRLASVNTRSETGAFANVRPLLGRPFDEAIRIIWPEAVAAELIRTFRHTLATGEPYSSKDFLNPRADIEQIEGYEWELHRITMPDGRPGVVCYYYDSTQLRRVEQQLKEADRRKDEFLATLAHELRNPLAPIRTGLQVMQMLPAGGPAVVKAREMMERQLGHMVRLVDDLMDVSRINSGKVELKREKLQVRAVVDHAVEASQSLVEAGGHTLAVTISDEPVWVNGDLTRLAQVVSNLLNNAAKYTPNGGRIALSAGVEGDEAVIAVTDNGTGISPDMLPKVFDLFAQVDRTLDRAQGGLGIGLSLVKKLLKMHGGTITASSPGLGQGSTFTVRLPLAPTTARGNSVNVASSETPTPRPAGRRVLVIDDNVDGAESLAMMLELLGHQSRATHDGPAGLAAGREFQPEVVFLDIGLPGMNGYEVAIRFRADPAIAGAVLVALTGWGSEDDKRKSQEAGFDFHLTKPIEVQAVQEMLSRFSTLPASGREQQRIAVTDNS